MSYKIGDRMQQTFLPNSIEDYVSQDDPVRVYDSFVDALDFGALGIPIAPFQAGALTYYPKQMVKLLVYGYSYGIRSSRKLERACHHNLSFIWLTGGLVPDYRTIARFRSTHKETLRGVLKQCVRLCVKLDLIEGNMLFIDGSKFRADASIDNTWTKEKCQKSLKKIEEHIDKLIDESESIDAQEQNEPSLVKIKERIGDKTRLMNKIKNVLADLEAGQQKSLNSTDPDCVKARARQGTHAVYNVQNVVDAKHGLIVHTEAVSQANDYNQLSRQTEQATAVLEHKPKHVCADCGYSSIEDIKEIDPEINVVIPSLRQAQQDKGLHPFRTFTKERFVYDAEHDEYVCPEGKRLTRIERVSDRVNRYYRCSRQTCLKCPHFGDTRMGKCTKSSSGREINHHINQDLKNRLEQNYAKPENQEIYLLRKQKVEHPFGHIKRNLGANQFLLRGRLKVNAEAAILATCFNIARLMTIVGVQGLINKLKNA